MKIYPLRLFQKASNFDFISFSKFSYAISITLSIISIFSVFYFGLNLGIDFKGGINIEIRCNKDIDVEKLRGPINELNMGEVSIQNAGKNNDFLIKFGTDPNNSQNTQKVVDKIKESLSKVAAKEGLEISYRKIDFVGPQVGKQLMTSGIKALVLSFLGIMIYIWFRFEWQFGIGVLIALVHDFIISMGFMSLSKLDFNLSSIAAILTIIGYSVNDSVVIYDRIRENLRKYGNIEINKIINISVNETLSRTTLTVVTTLIANLSLILFGGEAIKSFSLLVFFGIIFGTYSSIFISAPVLNILNIKKFK